MSTSGPLFDPARLSPWLSEVLGSPVRVLSAVPLGGHVADRPPPAGRSRNLLLEVEQGGSRRRLVLHGLASDVFGHEQAADRAADLLREREGAALPRHVRVLGAATVDADGRPRALGEGEVFLLTEHAAGRPYLDDLERIVRREELADHDRARLLALTDWLLELHELRRPDPALYRRRLRDLLGRGDGVMGLLDGLPEGALGLDAPRQEQLEHLWVAWRHRLRGLDHRLGQVHGDLHPGNIVFDEGIEFRVLGRRRGLWGEPADDVAALTTHYLVYSLRRHARLRGPLRDLFTIFFERYLERTADRELLAVLPPFYAWRALLLAHPVWFPGEPQDVRAALLRFAENLLAADSFEPERVDDYLA